MLTPAAGLSFLTFNLLCAPCFASIGAMQGTGHLERHRQGRTLPVRKAYAVASVVYTIGSYVYGDAPVASGIAVCIISIVVLAYLLVMKDPFMLKARGKGAATA